MRFCSVFVFLLTLLLMLLNACSVPKDIAYIQGIEQMSTEQLAVMSQTYSSMIVPDDLLTITVTSWDPSVVTPFNPPTYAYATQGEVYVTGAQQLHTYLVDTEGDIMFPVLGKVKAAGLSKETFTENLRYQISQYVKDAQVNVQIVNYKITILGDVARPGGFSIRNNRITILEAIGQAGDLTINANRTNIKIYRDVEGTPEVGVIDLTKPDVFVSPFYYLRQNDVVYVEPNDAKKKNSKYSQAQQYNITVVSTILSAISVLTVVLTNIFN